MSAPAPSALWAALRAGWPPAAQHQAAGFVIRDGQGGGSRVSAASPLSDTPPDIPGAEAAMRALHQTPLFQITPQDQALDDALAARGYQRVDDTQFLTIPAEDLARTPPPPISAFTVWPPLAIQRDLWAEGGIGPARLRVMARAEAPKCALLGRISDRAAGAGFVALSGGIAFVHALHILPDFRRQKLAHYMMQRAGIWARDHGAAHVALVVTRANAPAQALYRGLGFTEAGRYHYRRAAQD